MRILDRYVTKNVLALFFTCIFSFLFLYVIIDVFANLNDFLKLHTPVLVLIQYYVSYLPIIFVQVAPISTLLAILYTFGSFNRNNEIIAMRSSGLSIFQISKPIIIFGVILYMFIFWINDRFVPNALQLNQQIKTQIESGKKQTPQKTDETILNLSMYGLRNRLIFVNRFTPSSNTMEGITILEHDEHQNLIKKIVANKAVFMDGLWRFYHSLTYEFELNGQMKTEPRYMDEEIVAIPETPKEFLSQRQKTENMTIAQIQDYIWKLSKSGATGVIRKLKVDLYQRFAFPLTSFIIIFLAIPFSLKLKKRATGLSSLGLSIVVGFLYYVVNAISIALGYAGILMPIVAVSLSHVFFFTLSLYLIQHTP
ncbi:MAG TPA: LptF/LptG family permease [Candidatus Omnitrophota bacterium]|nr:LptF/LptG family permease [Candidatus Omnitrophota bacterium]HPT07339.1 LptF/LptG family permease [Candidatus Omnitrophota bacterium]